MLESSPTLAVGLSAPLLAAGGAAAVGIPIAIHILSRMRRQPVRWGAMRFLEIAYRQQKNKLRMENWLLLAVRCLIALILGLALSGPVLSGCAGSLTSGLDNSGRAVHLILDDALASGAQETADQSRLQRRVEEAKQIVEALEPRDRVAIWLSAKPAKPLIEDPTQDREAVIAALDELEPRASRPDLGAALEIAGAKIAENETPSDRAVVVVLGDLGSASDEWNEPAPAALQNMGDRARILVGKPSAEAGNVQLSQLTPRRTLVLSRSPDGGSSGAVAVTLKLRRFAAGSEAASTIVDLHLRDAEGNTLGSAQRDASWDAGQVETTLNVELPLPDDTQTASGPLAVHAKLTPGSIPDAISVDNTLLAAVEVRTALAVGVIDESESNQSGGIEPGVFINRALAPLADVSGAGMSLQAVAPTSLDADTLDTLDAAVVLRPDLLAADTWPALATFAKQGGLVWVVAPREEGSAVWTDPMRRAFELDWRIGLEPTDLAATGLPLDTRQRAPESLELLGAGWGELLRPIRVTRKLELIVPNDEAWLALSNKQATPTPEAEAEDDTPAATGSRRALLAQRRVGDGSVLLLSAALDADWTNLPTKPLFVPLLHETLRGVLGSAPRGIATTTAGNQPNLQAGWQSAEALKLAGIESAQPVALRPVGEGLKTTEDALAKPGVYAALGAGDTQLGGLVAVNADTTAGDTRPATDAQLDQWFDGLGSWDSLDLSNLAEQIASQTLRPNIGWALLWIVLALIAIETILARTASHAKRQTGGGVRRSVLGGLRTLRDVDNSAPSDAPGRAA